MRNDSFFVINSVKSIFIRLDGGVCVDDSRQFEVYTCDVETKLK